MKRYFFFFFLLMASSFAYSQQLGNENEMDARVTFSPEQKLDESFMECVYECWTNDTLLHSWKRDERILQIGRRFSKYLNYTSYRQDSVFCNIDKTNLRLRDVLRIEKDNNVDSRKSDLSYILKDKSAGKIENYSSVLMDRFVYEDSLKDLKWEMAVDTATFCGYLCHKATTHFRGRYWTAWYAEDLPVSDGPWKLGGLPGLVLKAYDDGRHQRFDAIVVRKVKSGITRVDRDEIRTTRERYNKSLADFKENPQNVVEGFGLMPKNADGTSAQLVQRLFFNPYELE